MKKKNPKNIFKKYIRQAHLILGLVSGTVIFIVAVTGCLWAFQEEIQQLTSDLPHIENRPEEIIPPHKAKQLALDVFPQRHVHGTLYSGKNEPIEVIFYEADPEFYQSVFLHPYTGEVLKIKDQLTSFFGFVLQGHRYLWLPHDIGGQIVAWSTVIFAILLITGIVLWWPKNKKARKHRFWFDWKSATKWKRKNYDLHSIAGFYVSFVAIIVIFTGLIMAFEWFKESVYHGLGGEKQVAWAVPQNISETGTATGNIPPMDRLFVQLQKAYPEAENLEFHYPNSESEAIYVEIGYQEGLYYSADYRFYDQYSLQELSSSTIYGVYEQAGFAEKVMRMNYDIHVGAIGGLPGKFLAFFASLICASLPVTGFLMWYGRKYKKKKQSPLPRHSEREVFST